ncbi:NAD(P)H-dependent oxidoreductase [Enterovirga aerilata]|uniref:Flavodoxin family protein n=1 Tax=Enterovirga aerilata TaxID=2730920 RepID=A0A849HVD1_9HYPH|nr:NAD(P)H-dependent oxidoreductase [Enterovirga sp. DB1703]NNM71476.1 flavodoxin family protein [Enterovirga sp. DB1703]
MRVLVVFAHPLQDSLHGSLHREIVSTLRQAGHEVDDCDLYAEGFEPVLTPAARARYFDPERNREGVEGYVARLFAAEALVLCFPVWCFGPPAILKGFMDRVMIPGVSFALGPDGRMHPNLRHIRKLVAVTSYGRPRLDAWWIGDPPRKLVTRYLRWFIARGAPVRYLGLYDLHRSEARLRTFRDRVLAEMGRF